MGKWRNFIFLHSVRQRRACDSDESSVEELQRFQVVLFTLRDPELNAVHDDTTDVRHMLREPEVMVREWESLNVEVARDPEPLVCTATDTVVRE